MIGFCEAEEKLFGPFHEYVVPVEEAVKLKVFPEQSGELLAAVGVTGIELIIALTVPADPVHPAVVAVTE